MTCPRAAQTFSPPAPSPESRAPSPVNVGLRLTATAAANPHGIAVAMPRGRARGAGLWPAFHTGHPGRGKRSYQTLTFQQLDDDSNLLADGLASIGAKPGARLVLMVPPS